MAAGVLEEVTLNWTDLTGAKTGATALGSNKFYRAQIFADFTVVFTYGRVGQSGQVQKVKGKDLADAQKQLKKKIDSKIAKGYTKVELRSDAEEAKKQAASKTAAPATNGKKSTATSKKSSLHPEVDSLLDIIYGSTSKAIASGLSSSAGATKESPLGNLSDAQLDKGADILEEIEKEIGKKAKKAALVELTNDYLSNIPRNIDHARKGKKLDLDAIVIDSKERIQEQRTFIGLLRDAFLQKAVFAEAAAFDDPHEVWYQGLKCDIEALDSKSDLYKEYKALYDKGQSPINSNFFGKLKVGRIWQLEQQGRKKDFDGYADGVVKKPNATGVEWGWHGTRTENLMGICKTGLVTPANLPKGVHVTGRAFGLGIYHTPCWADSGGKTKDEKGKTFTRYNGALKSTNYTSLKGAFYGKNNTADRGYLFLEQLALGVPELALEACFDKPAPKKGCDYIYARAHGHASLSNDEVVTFHENASRRVAILEVMHK
ncbi:MAG TPA: WGR domain-containing protein [Kofleriaceae bacterium]|jgi:predicted DNA-binding WGR domain protein|nr:WGR domain-containing protein [Kofleriaceae bacterium]